MYLSAWRIGWTVVTDGWLYRDDLGKPVDFELDAPAAIKNAVLASVRRWRLAQLILDVLPTSALVRRVVNTTGEVTVLLERHVVDMIPAYSKLMRATAKNGHVLDGTTWDHRQAAALASAMAGAQTCQYKVAAMAHDCRAAARHPHLCQLCHSLPGTFKHRYSCHCIYDGKGATRFPRDVEQYIAGIDNHLLRFVETYGLLVHTIQCMPPEPPHDGTITWHLQPTDGLGPDNKVYIDGSAFYTQYGPTVARFA